MGCIFAVLAGFFPRVALVIVWISGNRVERAFDDGWLLPLLGLVFLPFTTLLYVLAYSPVVELGGGRWLWVALGFVLDLSNVLGGARSRASSR